jgi:hypothetical protein
MGKGSESLKVRNIEILNYFLKFFKPLLYKGPDPEQYQEPYFIIYGFGSASRRSFTIIGDPTDPEQQHCFLSFLHVVRFNAFVSSYCKTHKV